MKNVLHASAFVLLLITLGSGVAGCDVITQETASASDSNANPARPSSVPAEANWVGGADGGVYALVTAPSNLPPRHYHGAIYNELGGIWYEGPLALQPQDSQAFRAEDAARFTLWDGDTLYLNDGRSLVVPGE